MRLGLSGICACAHEKAWLKEVKFFFHELLHSHTTSATMSMGGKSFARCRQTFYLSNA
jgi:hypothetical protein